MNNLNEDSNLKYPLSSLNFHLGFCHAALEATISRGSILSRVFSAKVLVIVNEAAYTVELSYFLWYCCQLVSKKTYLFQIGKRRDFWWNTLDFVVLQVKLL